MILGVRLCWRIAAVRPAVVGTPSSWISGDSVRGCSGWSARRPGNSQRESRLVAVRMLGALVDVLEQQDSDRLGHR